VPEQNAEKVDPPIEVKAATWSKAGQLDCGSKNGTNGGDARCRRPAPWIRGLDHELLATRSLSMILGDDDIDE
jgi:hypothetical protein